MSAALDAAKARMADASAAMVAAENAAVLRCAGMHLETVRRWCGSVEFDRIAEVEADLRDGHCRQHGLTAAQAAPVITALTALIRAIRVDSAVVAASLEANRTRAAYWSIRDAEEAAEKAAKAAKEAAERAEINARCERKARAERHAQWLERRPELSGEMALCASTNQVPSSEIKSELAALSNEDWLSVCDAAYALAESRAWTVSHTGCYDPVSSQSDDDGYVGGGTSVRKPDWWRIAGETDAIQSIIARHSMVSLDSMESGAILDSYRQMPVGQDWPVYIARRATAYVGCSYEQDPAGLALPKAVTVRSPAGIAERPKLNNPWGALDSLRV